MKNLVEAFQIFLKYGNPNYPLQCEHDVFYVYDYNIKDFSKEDIERLYELAFEWDEEEECFVSFEHGSI